MSIEGHFEYDRAEIFQGISLTETAHFVLLHGFPKTKMRTDGQRAGDKN